MRVMLKALQVELEETERQWLSEDPCPDFLVSQLGTLLDEATETSAGLGIPSCLPRLGSISEEFLQDPLCKPARCYKNYCPYCPVILFQGPDQGEREGRRRGSLSYWTCDSSGWANKYLVRELKAW